MAFLPNLRSGASPLLKRLNIAALWAERPSLLLSSCAVTLIASLLLGGGTKGGFLSDTILEFIAIPSLLLALSRLFARPLSPAQRGAEWALVLCMAIALVPLIQLAPLPPWLWTRLPQRDQIAGIFSLTHQELPWLPISVTPALTWAAVMGLLPPFAIFLSVIQLGYRERRTVSLVFVGLGIISAFLGLLQVAQGQGSPWRFFAVTNPDDAVGFFANRNHLAALLNTALLFGAAWAINVGYGFGSWRERRSIETTSVIVLTASFLGLVILIAAEASSRSRAGLGVLIVALFAALMLAIADRRRTGTGAAVKLILGSVLVAAVLVMQFALYRVLNRFDDPLAGARIEFAQNTIHAAEAYMPFGSGFGSFVAIYPNFEPPQDALDDRYVNHAHDDVLEVCLEGGVMSLMVMAGFAAWLLLMATKVWRRPPNDCRALDLLLARAASVVIPLIIVHSVFDYPLRTDAMMAVLALSCAFLIPPLQFATKGFRPRSVSVRASGEGEQWLAGAGSGRLALTGDVAPPVREISQEEKRRLARTKRTAAADDPASPPDGDRDFGDDAANETFDPQELAGGDADYDSDSALPEAVDLDELAGLTESAAVERRTSRPPDTTSAKIKVPVAVRPTQNADKTADRATARLREPFTYGDVKQKSVGHLTDALALLNQASAELVTRDELETRASEYDADAGGGSETASIGELAQRRMKILKLADSAARETQEGRDNAAKGHPRARVRQSPFAADLALDPAQRRAKALQLVESFMQTTGLSASTVTEALSDKVGNLGQEAQNIVPASSEPDILRDAEFGSEKPADAQTAHSDPGIPSSPLAEPANAAIHSVSEKATTEPDETQPSSLAPPTEAEVGQPASAAQEAGVVVESNEATTAGEVPAPHAQSDADMEMTEDAETTAAEASLQDAARPRQEWSDDVAWPQRWREADGGAAARPDQIESAEKIKPEAQPPRARSASGDLAGGAAASRQMAERDTEPSGIAKSAKVPNAKPGPQSRAVAKAPVSPRGEAPAVPEQARWGDDIEWPDAWRK